MVCSLGCQRVTAKQPGALLSSFADPYHFHDIIQTHEDANPDPDFYIKQSFLCSIISMYKTAVHSIFIPKNGKPIQYNSIVNVISKRYENHIHIQARL